MSLRAAWIAVCLVLAAGLATAQDFSDVEIKTHRVADGIYMLEGRGGNIGVSVGPDGVLLIDDQYAPLTERIVAAVGKLSERPIRFVLNTHWHGDHVGGNENLGRAGTLIVAHDNVRERMSTDQFIAAINVKVPAAPDGALPIVTFNDTVTFHLNGDEIHAFHVEPAHTDGDVMVYFHKSNVLHAGDVFFNGMYPFVDVSSGGSLDGLIAAVDRAMKLIDDRTRIIPGHGPVATPEEFAAFGAMLATIRSTIAPMVQAGRSLDEVVAAKPTSAFDEKWGNGFIGPDRFVTMVFESLSQ